MNGPGDYPLPHPLLASVMHFIPLQVHYQLQTRGYSFKKSNVQKPILKHNANLVSVFNLSYFTFPPKEVNKSN